CVVLYLRSGHSWDLALFPTRRSSDLRCGFWEITGHGIVVMCHIAHIDGLTVIPVALVVIKTADWSVDRYFVEVWSAQTDQLRIRDRKSTRLNSSHVKSSYAVFCLKKK